MTSSKQDGMRSLIVGNWKMHGLAARLAEIEALAAALKAQPADVDIVICPPFTLIERSTRAAAGMLAIGGQDCHPQPSGACTGDVSAEMLGDAGALAVIVGHSERRQQHGDTDSIVAAKAAAGRRAGLMTIICIGESGVQRDAGEALRACSAQLAGSLPPGLSALTCAIGYEPLWAIGTNLTPTTEQIVEMHAHIRRCLVTQLGAEGQAMRILYGGSVKADNARAILALPQVGGALIGGASLKDAEFESIVRSVPARSHAPSRDAR